MFGNYNISFDFLGFGAGAIANNTVFKMMDLIRAYSRNFLLRELATSIISDCRQKDALCEINAIFEYVQSNSRYVKDPLGTEMIQSPLIFMSKIKQGQVWTGDCDDYTVLLLTLYRLIGYPTAIRIASYTPNKVYGHVYGAVEIEGKWVAIDGIKENGYVGWEAPNATAIKTWRI